jgi:ferritin-like metal-binding protein YciE
LLEEEAEMSLDNLEDLFLDEVKDVFDAEKQLVKALPKLAKAATSAELKAAITNHLEETKVHVERLEKVFTLLKKPARGKKCKAMEGLVEEGSELTEEDGEPPVLDAAIICAAQKVEHYEIATYGTLVTWAKLLELDKIADIFEQTLNEENAADETLTGIAEEINLQAEAPETAEA